MNNFLISARFAKQGMQFAPSRLVTPAFSASADTLKVLAFIAGREMLAMRYKRWAPGAILFIVGSGLSSYNWSDSSLSASASMRISLQLPTQVSLRQTEDPAFDALCMKRMPTANYHIYVRDMDAPTSADTRFVGSHEGGCFPVSASKAGKLVFIVAE